MAASAIPLPPALACAGAYGRIRLSVVESQLARDPEPATVLIVEDQRELAELEGQMLRTIGYAAVLASDAAMALTALEESIPDLIILDLRLGSADGMQLLSTIRREYGSLPPILVVSGLLDREVSTHLELFENVSVLPKSRMDELRSAVVAMMDGIAKTA